MTHVEIVPTELSHIRQLCETLREREAQAFIKLDRDAERLITHTATSSFMSYAGCVDRKCVAIGGAEIRGIFSDDAYLWLVCSKSINDMPITFLRHTKKSLGLFHPFFARVYGFVQADFDRSVRWLAWLGFTIDVPVDGVSLFWLGGRPTDMDFLTTKAPLLSLW